MEKILIVDDEAFIRENLERIIAEDGYRPISTESPEEAIRIVAEEEISLVLLDLNLGSSSGLDVLRAMREVDPEILVIIITGYGTVESAVEALKIGAYDYIKKPFKADAIHLIVKLALETQNLRRKVKRLSRDGSGINMAGNSPQLLQIFQQIREVAKHEMATVLITGDSGTGKELVAQAIHNLSPRSQQPFIEINCGSLPFNLLETELFGHERGAFTDAKNRKIGLFEEADSGSIFLDEIGEMDVSLQVKLLRVLEDRKIRRLGGSRNIDINVRIIAATNADLKGALERKEFREDLYYRLNVFPIHIPPRYVSGVRIFRFYLSTFCNASVRSSISRYGVSAAMPLIWLCVITGRGMFGNCVTLLSEFVSCIMLNKFYRLIYHVKYGESHHRARCPLITKFRPKESFWTTLLVRLKKNWLKRRSQSPGEMLPRRHGFSMSRVERYATSWRSII